MANRPMAPHLQIWKWGPHMAVSILHRVTGDGMALVGLGVLLWWLGAASALMFVASLAVVPWLAARIPVDYFAHAHRQPVIPSTMHPATRLLLLALKNIAGLVLLCMGLIMLVTPGQGVLTILLGVSLLNFPGKYRAERWLVSRPGVLRTLNWLRTRQGLPPLQLDGVL